MGKISIDLGAIFNAVQGMGDKKLNNQLTQAQTDALRQSTGINQSKWASEMADQGVSAPATVPQSNWLPLGADGKVAGSADANGVMYNGRLMSPDEVNASQSNQPFANPTPDQARLFPRQSEAIAEKNMAYSMQPEMSRLALQSLKDTGAATTDNAINDLKARTEYGKDLTPADRLGGAGVGGFQSAPFAQQVGTEADITAGTPGAQSLAATAKAKSDAATAQLAARNTGLADDALTDNLLTAKRILDQQYPNELFNARYKKDGNYLRTNTTDKDGHLKSMVIRDPTANPDLLSGVNDFTVDPVTKLKVFVNRNTVEQGYDDQSDAPNPTVTVTKPIVIPTDSTYIDPALKAQVEKEQAYNEQQRVRGLVGQLQELKYKEKELLNPSRLLINGGPLSAPQAQSSAIARNTQLQVVRKAIQTLNDKIGQVYQ